MDKRGLAQVSMEYLMVAGVVLLIILPAAYMFFSYSQSSNAEIKEGQITKLGSDIVNTAETVYYQGKPTRITIKGTLPDNVAGIDVVSDWTRNVNQIVFYVRKQGGVSSMVFSSDVRLSGSISPSAGLKSIIVSAQEADVPYVFLSSSNCGDSSCDAAAGESCQNCFEDCGGCATCYDSDGGGVPNTRGVCVNATRSYYDFCVGSGLVKEFQCGGSPPNACVSSESSCSECVYGACVS